MLRYCGLCGYFRKIEGEQNFGNCTSGNRREEDNTTFSTNTCDNFVHKRHFQDGKIIPLDERRVPNLGGR